MGFFGLFNKKEKKEMPPPTQHPFATDTAWTPPPLGGNPQLTEPLQPLAHLQPLSLERPQSFNDSDMQTLLAKLDLMNERLDSINRRLDGLEKSLQQPLSPPQAQKPQPQPQTPHMNSW